MVNNMKKEHILLIFIIIQPILDLITSIQSIYTDINVSLSALIRGIALVVTVILLLFRNEKKIRIYMIAFIIFSFFHLLNNYLNKGFSPLLSEMYTYIRYFYFPIILMLFYKVYQDNFFDRKIITWIGAFYFGISFLAFITGTSFVSYMGDDKIGWNGWFYSANERGNTYSILLPLLIPFFIKNKNYILLIFLAIFVMLLLGTKVGYLSVLITLISSIIILLKNMGKNRDVMISIAVISVLLILVLYLTPYLPVYKNILIQNSKIEEILDNKTTMIEITANTSRYLYSNSETQTIPSVNYNDLINNKEENLVFSGRELFFDQNVEYFMNQGIVNQLLGSGMTNKEINHVSVAEKVEIDIFDVFFTFGIIGFVIYFIPILYIINSIFKLFVLKFKHQLNVDTWFMLISIINSFAISFISGHILLAPSVSIFLVLVICKLYNELKQKEDL